MSSKKTEIKPMEMRQGHCRIHLNPAGNWCNHNPYDPKFYTPPEQHGYRPDVILQAQASLKNFYWSPSRYLPSLIISRTSFRQERTEGRERDATVLGVILHYLELASMRVGIPNKDGFFKSLSMKDIALRTGWRTKEDDNDPKTKDKGIKRVWRAMQSLKKAGYITIHRRVEKALEGEKEYSSLPAIRAVSTILFHELNVSIQKLNMRRKRAASRLKRIYRTYLDKVEADVKKGVKRATQQLLDFKNNISGAKRKPKRTGRAHGLAAMAKMKAKLIAEGKIPDTS